MNKKNLFYFMTLGVMIFFYGCLARPVIKKTDDALHRLQNEEIKQQVVQKAQTGDWLVIRGYHGVDNLVANATGIPLSHVAIYNADSLEVIEAEGKGVHRASLEDFVDKAYRLLIIRPRWRSAENGVSAWEQARRLVGRDYDFLGTVGFNYPSRYYCSELAVSIYRPWYRGNEKFPTVIKPGELFLYGRIIYDSLPRDEK